MGEPFQPRVSKRAFAATILIGVLPARPAWAHGEQLLVNAGVAFLLIPLWLYIVRWQIQTLPEEILISFLRQLVNAGGDTTYRATRCTPPPRGRGRGWGRSG